MWRPWYRRTHSFIRRLPGVKIIAVCDPDRERLSAAAQKVASSFNNKPDEVVDIRKLMDRKDFDAISVATMQYGMHYLQSGLVRQAIMSCGETFGSLHMGEQADGQCCTKV